MRVSVVGHPLNPHKKIPLLAAYTSIKPKNYRRCSHDIPWYPMVSHSSHEENPNFSSLNSQFFMVKPPSLMVLSPIVPNSIPKKPSSFPSVRLQITQFHQISHKISQFHHQITRFPHGFPGFPRVFPWFSHGFPRVFPTGCLFRCTTEARWCGPAAPRAAAAPWARPAAPGRCRGPHRDRRWRQGLMGF